VVDPSVRARLARDVEYRPHNPGLHDA
jgi:hypothetical protein